MRIPFTLSLYIGWIFLTTMIVVFFCFLFIIYLGDLTELMRRAAGRSNLGFSTVAWITLHKLPGTSEVALPFTVLIACIISFSRLTRRSELSAMRAAGISVWQFCAPACAAALLFGVLSVVAYNPLAARLNGIYQNLEAEHIFGRKEGRVSNVGEAVWLRQSNSIGTAIINAKRGLEHGTRLFEVVIYQLDHSDRFLSRFSADRATYHPGRWSLEETWVVGRSGKSVYHPQYWVETTLSRTQVAASLGIASSMSFWDLPQFIKIAKLSGLAANEYRVQYQMLLAQPIWFCVIALMAAVFSLRLPRLGQIKRLVIAGPLLAIGLFLANHVSRSLGDAGLIPATIAAWLAVSFAGIVSLAVLFFQEDG